MGCTKIRSLVQNAGMDHRFRTLTATGLPPHLAALLALGLGWVLTAAGCAGGGTFLSETAPPPTSVHTVLLLPMNFDATPSSHAMAEGVRAVQGEVKRYLESLEREVEHPPLSTVMREWNAVILAADVSGDEDDAVLLEKLAAARAELARRLAERYPADVVAMPTLLVREGRYVGLELTWDGVTRPVPLRQQSQWMGVHRIGGTGSGTSLRVTLFSPEGERFFERYAGMEPTHGYTIAGPARGPGVDITPWPRTDLFEDPEVIEYAVKKGFEPYLAPRE